MVFPEMVLKEFDRLKRFDMDFDLPEHFLPEFPAPMYLTTHKGMGDVSQGRNVTIDNYHILFNGLLNPKQLEGLRLLVTQFPQQQFNATEDRKSEKPSLGVTCFDCHANGHTVAATHLVGDIRPQSHRSRLDVPSLRGVNIQRLFRVAARAQERRGFYRVRAAGRVLRRRPGDGHEEGRQHPRARQPGPLHGRVPGAAGLPARAEARRLRAAEEGRGHRVRAQGEAVFFSKGRCAGATRPPTTPTTVCTTSRSSASTRRG